MAVPAKTIHWTFYGDFAGDPRHGSLAQKYGGETVFPLQLAARQEVVRLIRANDFAWLEFSKRPVDDLDVTQNVTASSGRRPTRANLTSGLLCQHQRGDAFLRVRAQEDLVTVHHARPTADPHPQVSRWADLLLPSNQVEPIRVAFRIVQLTRLAQDTINEPLRAPQSNRHGPAWR